MYVFVDISMYFIMSKIEMVLFGYPKRRLVPAFRQQFQVRFKRRVDFLIHYLQPVDCPKPRMVFYVVHAIPQVAKPFA